MTYPVISAYEVQLVDNGFQHLKRGQHIMLVIFGSIVSLAMRLGLVVQVGQG